MISNTNVYIDEAAIFHNTEILRSHLNPSTKIISVIKANGYGCGLLEVAQTCEKLRIDMLAVLNLEQATILRKGGIQCPILILGQTLEANFEEIFQLDVTQVALSYEFALRLNDFALNSNRKAKVHIKVDTGLNRLGLTDIDEIKHVYTLPGLDVTGIYSHFTESQSYEAADVAFSDLQLDKFKAVLKTLKDSGVDVGLTHMQNSPSIIRQGDLGFGAVRCGMVMFGLFHPSQRDIAESMGYRFVHKMVTHVALVREIQAHEYIGYGRTYETDKPTRLAVVSAGYCDGVMKALTQNKGHVIVKGQACPVIGDIAMSQFFVDVSGVDCQAEDEIVIFGDENQNIYQYIDTTGQSINELII